MPTPQPANPKPPAPQILVFIHQWASGGSQVGGSRTYWHYGGAAPAISDLDALAVSYLSTWQTNMDPVINTNQSLLQLQIVDLTSPTSAASAFHGGSAGTRVGAELPLNCAVQIQYYITRRYRGGKPRSMFIGGSTADTTDGRHWTAAFQSAYTTAYTAVVNAMEAYGGTVGALQPYNVSYYSGLTADSTASPWDPVNVPNYRTAVQKDPIVRFGVSLTIGSARRRLRAGS